MGTVPKVVPFSRQLCGRQQSSPAIEAIVQGVGANATSFPQMDTMRMSCEEMLSRMNLSCGSRERERWLSVVASTAVLIAAYFVLSLLLLLLLAPLFFSLCRSFSRWFNQNVTSATQLGGSNNCA